MVRWIVGAAQRYQRLVLAVAIAMIAAAAVQLRDAQLEALPEFGPVRVEVQTEALGMSAEEVEQLITNPMEQEFFNGLPWLDKLRSRSIPGLSSIEMTFQPGTDLMRARQVVQERLTMVPALPAAASRAPMVIQPLSATSRVMLIGLSSAEVSLIDVSVLARWTIAPRLMGIPGVANVTIWGLRDRQLQVLVDPQRLRDNGVTLDQVLRTAANAMWVSPLTFVEASTPGTGGFIDTPNQRIEVQHNQPIRTAAELAQVTVQGAENATLRLGQVARIEEDHQPLIGDAVVAQNPGVMLVVERFPGAGIAQVTAAVEDALDAMAPGLSGIRIDTTVYRPASFAETLRDNLGAALAALLIVLVLLLAALLFNWRLALVGVGTIAVSLASAVVLLSVFGVPLHLMTLAGLTIALGIVVDDAVVGVDAMRRRLRESPDGAAVEARADGILEACLQTRGPLLVATVIIAVSLAPVLVLDGLVGSFLRPVALAYGIAVLASLAVALVVTPALAMLVLAGRSPVPAEPPFLTAAQRAQSTLLARVLRAPAWSVVAVGLAILAVAAVLLPQWGGQPLSPSLRDRNLLVTWDGAPGASRQEMDRITAAASAELRAVPGVRNVGALVGRAVSSDRIVNINSGELWVSIDPSADYDRTEAAVEAVVAGYPGLRREVTTYSDQQLRQAATGAAGDLVVRLYGSDYGVLTAKAEEVRQIISRLPGVVDPQVSTQADEPTVEIEVSVAKAARFGLKPGDVRRSAATLVSGTIAGSLFEEQKVFDVVVWGVPAVRHSMSSINDLRIDAPVGGLARLGDVADVRIRPAPQVITHDQVSRSVDVVADVSGRSLATVTAEVKRSLGSVTFPREHHLEVLTESQQRQSTDLRTTSYVVAAAIAIFFLFQVAVTSWRLSILLFGLMPLSVSGGLLAAALVRDSLSAAALMGLLAVLGLAARGGILLIREYQRLADDGAARDRELVLLGTRHRFAPTIITALVTGLALVPPLVFGAVAGLEVVVPLAVVILGGLVTTTLVTLFVLPALYLRFGGGGGPVADGAIHSPTTGPATGTVAGPAAMALIAAAMVLAGCGTNRTQPPGDEPKPAVVETIAGAATKRVTLTPRAAQRLGVTTAPVRGAASPGGPSTMVVPYSAIVYDSAGVGWVYTVPAPLTYVRARAAIVRIDKDAVSLSAGPPVGTLVVTQGAMEIYGAELGVGQ